MNIKDFLIDNYIWIIVIILITIITIIGFLADKKKENKKEKEIPPINPNQNSIQPNNMEQIQPQQEMLQNQMNNNMGISNATQNNLPQQPVNNIIGQGNSNPNMINNQQLESANSSNQTNFQQPIQPEPMVNPTNNMSLMNDNTVSDQQNQTVPQESVYKPLEEQKPNIPPQPVPNFANMRNNQEMAQPMNSGFNQAINQTAPIGVPTQNINQPQNTQPMAANSSFNYGSNNQNNMMTNQISQTTIPQPINPQPIMTNNQEMMNHMNTGSYQNNNYTVPMGAPSQVIPQPIPPQPMMPNQINQNIGMQNSVSNPQQMNGTVPQANLNAQAPMNFVFNQQSNNQNM